MKKRILQATFIILMSLSFQAQSQFIGGEAFMQGHFIEAGINSCGAFGTNALPPTLGSLGQPYHLNTSSITTSLTGLGFIADEEQDGWATYTGDYFVPGSPVEGWSVHANNLCFINSDQGCLTNDVPGGITSFSYDTINGTRVVWTGTTSNGLQVTQIYKLYPDSLHIDVDVILCNTTATDMDSVAYARNVDPDNDAQQYGEYMTRNIINAQVSNGDPSSIVIATGTTHPSMIGYYSSDPSSIVSFGGFSTICAGDYTYPSLFSSSGFQSTVGASQVADEAIHIGFDVGTLSAGVCDTLNFKIFFNAVYLPGYVPTFTYENVDCTPVSGEPYLFPGLLPGGVFSFATPPTDSAVINSTNGILTDMSENTTYFINYTAISGTDTQSINSTCISETCISTLYPYLGVAYETSCNDSSFAPDLSSAYVGNGHFEIQAAGTVTIDSLSGIIHNATAFGDYTVLFITHPPLAVDTIYATFTHQDCGILPSIYYYPNCADSSLTAVEYGAVAADGIYYLTYTTDTNATIDSITGVISHASNGNMYHVLFLNNDTLNYQYITGTVYFYDCFTPFELWDPCQCADPGYFSEEVGIVGGTPPYTVLEFTGAYSSPGISMTAADATTYLNSGYDTLHFLHRDGIGYNIKIMDNTGQIQSIGNLCHYPVYDYLHTAAANSDNTGFTSVTIQIQIGGEPITSGLTSNYGNITYNADSTITIHHVPNTCTLMLDYAMSSSCQIHETIAVNEVGINDAQPVYNLTVSQNLLHIIKPTSEKISTITVYDAYGKMVIRIEEDRNEIDISKLNTGYYIVSIQDGRSTSNLSFIK